jgi:AAA domain-containing protein
MSLVGELGRERFLRDALEPVLDGYDRVIIDTPPNLGLLTVNALVRAEVVLAPVSAEDEGALHGVLELRATLAKLADWVATVPAELIVLLTRWVPQRVSSRTVEETLISLGLAPAVRSGCAPRSSRKPRPNASRWRHATRTAPSRSRTRTSSPGLSSSVADLRLVALCEVARGAERHERTASVKARRTRYLRACST